MRDPSPDRGKTAAFPISAREFVALLASLMALNALAIDAMLPALEQIATDFALLDANRRQWVVAIYLFGMGIGSLIYGPLGDRYGRRPVLLGALALYVLFALLCAVSHSFEMLIAGRLAQGLSAAATGVLGVSIIRDRFAGDAMARIMSLVFIVFMAVPIVAPSIGAAVLMVADWPMIFLLLAAMGVAVFLWVFLRLPETLDPSNVIPIRGAAIVSTWGRIIGNRLAAGYVIASGVVLGALFGFINSAQQIFFDIFSAGHFFPLAFAMVASAMMVSNYFNARIVTRFGARRVSHMALLAFIILSALHFAVALAGGESIAAFIALIAVSMSMVGFIGANFSSIAMQPFGAMAGAGSSFQQFVRLILSALIGAAIGQQFDGTVVPITAAFLVAGLAGLALVLWAERGRLFRPPDPALAED